MPAKRSSRGRAATALDSRPASRSARIRCGVIGEGEAPEFREPLARLAEQAQLSRWETVSAAVAHAASEPTPELLVLLQARPGQVSAAEVETLHRTWPLAKLIGLLGAWCDGEGRTGRPWPGVWRLSAPEFSARMRLLFSSSSPPDPRVAAEQWDRSAGMQLRFDQHPSRTSGAGSSSYERRPRAWLLPRLVSEAERVYFEASEPLGRTAGRLLVVAGTAEAFEAVADAAGIVGLEARWERPLTAASGSGDPECGYQGVVWDALRGDADEWDAIVRCAARTAPAPVWVLQGFPRWEDGQRGERLADAWGIRPGRIGILPKPLRLADLCGELVRRIGGIATTGTTGRVGGAAGPHAASRRSEDV